MKSEPEAADVVVVGGGIAGLAAARRLAGGRRRVVLIESRDRLGGRIFTERPAGWPAPVELGAQFIHGGNEDLWRLVKAARARVVKVPNAHWRSNRGVISRIAEPNGEIGSVTRLIDVRKAGGLSFAAYFERYPPAVAKDAWMLARSFVEGFEAAPMGEISAKSLASETLEEEQQFTVTDGYDRAVAFLASECLRLGVRILQGTAVKSVEWKRGRVCLSAVEGSTGARRAFVAKAAVITLPLGVLKARAGKGAVAFYPPLAAKRAVLTRMGFGEVTRLAFRFSRSHWKRMLPAILRHRRPGGFGFLHGVGEGVPVWWSLSDQPVIVGWAGGPPAVALGRLSAGCRKRRALSSLAKVLGVRTSFVAAGAVDMLEWEWSRDPYSRGAYSFTAAGQDGAARKLAQPLKTTLFFAGEATAEGSEVGTVHGALKSGMRAAKQVLSALPKRKEMAKKAATDQ
jgi:monoamine oxidase